VGDDEDGAALLLEVLDGLQQCGLADVVEVGVGLVEHQQPGSPYMARARAMRWRWPPDSRPPAWPISVS
jgi:hypothetical protein